MNIMEFRPVVREHADTFRIVACVIVAILAGAICLVIGGSIATVIITLITLGGWLLWEISDFNDGRLPIVGGMISCWRFVHWAWGYDEVFAICLNLLFFYRLLFILPLAYLYLW